MTHLEPIAQIEFVGGALRPVYEDKDGHYVTDDAENRVYRVWFVLRDDADTARVVDTGDDTIPF